MYVHTHSYYGNSVEFRGQLEGEILCTSGTELTIICCVRHSYLLSHFAGPAPNPLKPTVIFISLPGVYPPTLLKIFVLFLR